MCCSAATALPPTSYSSPGDLSIDQYHETHKAASGDDLRLLNGNLVDKDKRHNLDFDLHRPCSRKDSIRDFSGRGGLFSHHDCTTISRYLLVMVIMF